MSPETNTTSETEVSLIANPEKGGESTESAEGVKKPEKSEIEKAVEEARNHLQKSKLKLQEVNEQVAEQKKSNIFLDKWHVATISEGPDYAISTRADYERRTAQEKAQEAYLVSATESLTAEMQVLETTGKMSDFSLEKQRLIRTEMIRKALDPNKIPNEFLEMAKKEILPPNGTGSLSPEQEAKSKELALQKWAKHEQTEYTKKVEADNKQTPPSNTASEYLKDFDQKLKSAITLDDLKKKTPLSDVEKNAIKAITMEDLAKQMEKSQDFIDFTQMIDGLPELQKHTNDLMNGDENKKFDFKTLYTDSNVRKKVLKHINIGDSTIFPKKFTNLLSLDQDKFAEAVHEDLIRRLEEGNIGDEERKILKGLNNDKVNALLDTRDVLAFDGETPLQIGARVLHEDTLRDMVETIGPEADWTQMPDMIKQFATTNSFFRMPDKATSKHLEDRDKGIHLTANPPLETSTPDEIKKYKDELKKYAGFESQEAVKNTLEKAEKDDNAVSRMPEWFRSILEFIATIASALGSEAGDRLLAKLKREQDPRDDQDNADRNNGRDINNIEYSGEIGQASPEMSENGFKGGVMNSIFRWEYQKGHDVEVVPAGRSGLTLCGGIDLAYTPFTKVQEIFAGILQPETIQKLRPFCHNGHTGPTRDRAESELRSAPGLKQEIQSQFTIQNMSLAFTRSLAIDWGRLLAQHGNAIKDAPGYVQTIMLGRFYHDGSGRSSDFIRALQKTSPPFNHESLISLLNARINRRSEAYYGNRIRKEIAYAKNKPGDIIVKIPTLANRGGTGH